MASGVQERPRDLYPLPRRGQRRRRTPNAGVPLPHHPLWGRVRTCLTTSNPLPTSTPRTRSPRSEPWPPALTHVSTPIERTPCPDTSTPQEVLSPPPREGPRPRPFTPKPSPPPRIPTPLRPLGPPPRTPRAGCAPPRGRRRPRRQA